MCCWGRVGLLATAWTLAWEDAVLAVTCEFHGMVGVGKVTLVESDGSEESDSDSSHWIESSCATRAAASSSSVSEGMNDPMICSRIAWAI